MAVGHRLVVVLGQLQHPGVAARTPASRKYCALGNLEEVASAESAARWEALGLQDPVLRESISNHPRSRKLLFDLEHHQQLFSGHLPSFRVLLSTCRSTCRICLFGQEVSIFGVKCSLCQFGLVEVDRFL